MTKEVKVNPLSPISGRSGGGGGKGPSAAPRVALDGSPHFLRLLLPLVVAATVGGSATPVRWIMFFTLSHFLVIIITQDLIRLPNTSMYFGSFTHLNSMCDFCWLHFQGN